jgi:Protein of unknown function (DUF2917)
MAAQELKQTQPSLSPPLPGTWKLPAGRAITLQPREAGVLRVAHGQIWATCDGPHTGPLNDLGDRVVAAGGQLRLRAGERLVIEAWNVRAPAYFSWEPTPRRVHGAAQRFAPVIQPWSDLRLALVFGAGAAVRLLAGLAGVARDLVAPPRRRADASSGRCPA